MNPQTNEQLQSDNSPRATVGPLRWLGAVICVVYGFAKLNGSQFTVLDSELARPLGDVDGFWLTWHYFGYSTPYGTLIAILQIVGGLLLVWPRTALLAALLLLPVFVNIFLVDVFFGIELGATIVAFVMLGCLAAVIAPHSKRLWAAVLLDSSPKERRTVRVAAMVLIVGCAFGFTWWAANYNNRFPTPIDGVWVVVPDPAQEASATNVHWQRVFFERNRAHMAVFRSAAGTDRTYHFEVDGQGIVRIWETWLTKGALIMEGSVDGSGQLVLDGRTERHRGRVTLRREKSAT